MPDELIHQLEGRIVALERELADLRRSMSQPTVQTRIERYRKRWTCRNLAIKDNVRCTAPVLLLGEGSISIGANVLFGWHRDPFFFDGGYILIDARTMRISRSAMTSPSTIIARSSPRARGSASARAA